MTPGKGVSRLNYEGLAQVATARTPVYLVDASIYLFRAYFSLPPSITDRHGRPANAVYGYAGFLRQLLASSRGAHFVFAFDESLTTSFRNTLYPAYKANRDLPPEELVAQIGHCQALTQAMGLTTIASSHYEADDLIGTIAARLRTRSYKMIYVTSDKDLAQLMRPGDCFWNFARDEKLTHGQIKQRFGVRPSQIVDLLALTGDPVDNIPGIPGIGPRTAIRLLESYGSLEGIYKKLKKVAELDMRGAKRTYQLLEIYQEQAFLSQSLARIAEDAPLRLPAGHFIRKRPDLRKLEVLCDALAFGERMRAGLRQSAQRDGGNSE